MESSIYLAGGCFWGVEGYFKLLKGIKYTEVGYANGNCNDTSYEKLEITQHAEAVKIVYSKHIISLPEILMHYWRIIDPISLNQQGNDIGIQYRTGIYYTEKDDIDIIMRFVKYQQDKISAKIAVQIEPLKNFIKAEEYHQGYLDKNPFGYCHIDLSLAKLSLHDESNFIKPDLPTIKQILNTLEYEITQNNATEPPFSSPLNTNFEDGIYIDIITKKPLFSSRDKFDSGCGWPSFSKPITTDCIDYVDDYSHNMARVEVKSKNSNSHLGHVFDDGPKKLGGLRYCINGTAIKFIPLSEMDAAGYGDYKIYV